MSDNLGTYDFLPWLRVGAAAKIERPDDDGPQPGVQRASFSVDVVFNGNAQESVTGVKLQLFGPGDVTSLDPRVVIRTWPGPNVFEAEPNYFPFIEFEQPDLPWRYTPARSASGERLKPWLNLIVLRETDEIASYKPSSGQGGLGVVTVDAKAALPNLKQSWAWAHAQIAGGGADDPATVLSNEPHRIISRIVSPRRLDPKTPYAAFLVPTFKIGVVSGLGQKPDPKSDALELAWNPGDTGVTLPVYHQWRFQTGGAGDFESLVRRLQPRVLPPTVGIRDMDVSAPGPQGMTAGQTPLGLEGALKAVSTVSTNWVDPGRSDWIRDLSELLNRPDALLRGVVQGVQKTRIVGPPLYGRWHAARQTVDASGKPYWFNELNLDPRLRTSAGLGTMVVQDQQQQLMAGAWQQVGPIRQINEELRHTQLAREVSNRLYSRHVTAASPYSLLMMTAPVHGRVQIGAAAFSDPRGGLLAIGGADALIAKTADDPASVRVSARALLGASPVGRAVFDSQFRRISRPLGPLGRRQGLAQRRRQSTLLDRMNQRELIPVSPMPPIGKGVATPSSLGQSITPGWFDPSLMTRLAALPRRRLIIVGVVLILAALLLAVLAKLWIIVLPLLIVGVTLLGAALVPQLAEVFQRRVALQNGKLTPELIASFPPRPDFVLVDREDIPEFAVSPKRPKLGSGGTQRPLVAGDNMAAQAFRLAAMEAFADVGKIPVRATAGVSVDLAQVHRRIAASLDPLTTIQATTIGRLRLAASVDWEPDDPIEPVMAYPVFPQPMYEPLRDLSQDWLLPGLDKVPPDTLSLLESNEAFVEAYMVGLNHEMARELLYHEYPTDQRGSYFRQFWDPGSYVPTGEAKPGPDDLKDIQAIHTWSKHAHLGDNSARVTEQGGNYLVLLVRGELLRRYPNTIIYASPAIWKDNKRTLLDDVKQEKHPLFHGSLHPDVVFLGFDLTPDQARGTPQVQDNNPGWFFVLQEQPSEPRFGLEDADGVEGQPVKTWPELSWGHLVAKAGDKATLAYINLDDPNYPKVADAENTAPNVRWSSAKTKSSDLAFITFRDPYRVAVHASAMLPEPEKK